ncbi:MAG: tripartite tricarboxylate transporter TctB family protein [Beijerinckiaceae bacterium]|nr:tripartite tricarboxylate transporter TctB family protein [Beijerinckiaceae bacterium]
MIRVTHPQDFWSGLLFMSIGAAAAYLGRDFVFGTMTRMGPGFLPTVLAWLLIAIGAFVAARGLTLKGSRIEPSTWRPQIVIVIAIVLFALMIERVGLVPTVFVVTNVASIAATEFRFRDSLLLSAGLSVACYLVFVTMLGLPLVGVAWNP